MLAQGPLLEHPTFCLPSPGTSYFLTSPGTSYFLRHPWNPGLSWNILLFATPSLGTLSWNILLFPRNFSGSGPIARYAPSPGTSYFLPHLSWNILLFATLSWNIPSLGPSLGTSYFFLATFQAPSPGPPLSWNILLFARNFLL